MAKPQQPTKHTTAEISPQSKKLSYYQGVIPPAEMMEHYAQIDSSFPDRILKMAELEGESRRKKENKLINFSFFADMAGKVFALASCGGVLYCGYLFLIHDAAVAGAGIITGVIVTLVVAFLKGRNNNE